MIVSLHSFFELFQVIQLLKDRKTFRIFLLWCGRRFHFDMVRYDMPSKKTSIKKKKTRKTTTSLEEKIEKMSVDQLFDMLENDVDGDVVVSSCKENKKEPAKAEIDLPDVSHATEETQLSVQVPEEDSEQSSDETEKVDKGANSETIALRVDKELLQTLQKQVENRKRLRKNTTCLVKIFRAACMVIESNQSLAVASSGSKEAKTTNKKEAVLSRKDDSSYSEDEMHLLETGFISHNIHFVDVRVYQNAMKLCLELIPKSLDALLELEGLDQLDKIVLDEPKSLTRWNPQSSKRWNSLRAPMKVFFYFLRVLLETISNEAMKRYLLKIARRCSPYLLKMLKLARLMIKTVVSIWAHSEEESTRGMAYFTLYCWSLYDSDKYLPKILKKMQSSFKDDISKQGNLRRLAVTLFAANSLVDLFGLDIGISYSSIFIHLRELAVTLKRAITSQGKEFRYLVENWQFVNQLRLYGMVLSSYPEKDQLRPLIYPYVQIALGVLNFSYSPNCFGLLFHCAHFLNDLMKHSNVYIPLASSLIRVLFCAELKKKPTNNEVKEKPIIWRTTLKISQRQLNSRAFRDGVVSQVVYLLAEYFSILSRNVAFPELIVPSVISLREFIKNTKVFKFRQMVKELTQQLEENAERIRNLRKRSHCGPTQLQSDKLQSPLDFAPEEKTPMEKFFELEQQRLIKEEKLLTSTVIDLEEPWTQSNNTLSKQDDKSFHNNTNHSKPSEDEDIVEDLVLSP